MPPLVTGNAPVTPVDRGRPVAFVRVPLDGVPSAPPFTTKEPAVPVFTASAVATPVPRPETPVEIGSPVALVRVPDDGVPNAPPFTTNAPAVPTSTPSAVMTLVPVVIVDGAKPAPPPTTSALAARAAEDAQVVPLEKYGMPPDVPATVSARVPLDVIGDPLTEIRPPVNVWPTEVTVPAALIVCHDNTPAPFVLNTWFAVPSLIGMVYEPDVLEIVKPAVLYSVSVAVLDDCAVELMLATKDPDKLGLTLLYAIQVIEPSSSPEAFTA